jgi:hypothetical protein
VSKLPALAVSVACGSALERKIGGIERKIGGIERRRPDPPMMMPTISVCSYASVVGCGSALDRTRASVQTKNAAEIAN